MRSLFTLASFMFFVLACGQSNYDLAFTAYQSGDYERAYREFSFLADGGDIRAQYYLGYMYENGEFLIQDYQEAARWYKKSAKRGYPESQIRLAKLYITGLGVD